MKKKLNSIISLMLVAIMIFSSAICGTAVSSSDASEPVTTIVTDKLTEEVTENVSVETTQDIITTEEVTVASTENVTTETESTEVTETQEVTTSVVETTAAEESTTLNEETTSEDTTASTEGTTSSDEDTTAQSETTALPEVVTTTSKEEETTNESTTAPVEDTTAPAEPENPAPEKVEFKVTADKKGVTVKWDYAFDVLPDDYRYVKGYTVYRKTADSSWKSIKTVNDGKLEYTDTKVEYNKKYFYTVRAFYYTADGKKITGSYDKTGIEITNKYVMIPSLYKAEKYKTKYVKISWSSVTAATKYALYRSDAKDGKYTKIYEGTTKYYIDKKISAGNTYFYKVKAYTNSKASSASDAVSYKFIPETPQFNKNFSVTENSVKLKWTKSEGADGYVIYRRNKTKDSWKKIKTIKAGDTVSYTDKKLDSAKIYYYLIKAYYKDADGNNYTGSTSVTTKTLAAPKTIKTSTNARNLLNTISWSKVSGASGYEIYVKVKGTSWTLLATTDSSTRTYTNMASINSTYEYKVRAMYESYNISYGPYSSVSKVTVNYLPEITYELPEKGISNPSNIKMVIKNKGKYSMRIQSTDAVLLRVSESSSMNLEVNLKMKKTTSGKYVEYIDIPAGKSATVYLYMEVKSFNYVPTDFITFMFTFNKGIYVAALSETYGSQIYYYGQQS